MLRITNQFWQRPVITITTKQSIYLYKRTISSKYNTIVSNWLNQHIIIIIIIIIIITILACCSAPYTAM